MAIDIVETWANTGDISIIPDDTQPDGSVSFKQGWGNDYQLDPATVANAKKLSRSNFNYLFSLLTTNQQEQLLYGFNNHIVGKTYPAMARVRGADGLIYESTVETNTTPPSADWIEFGATDEYALKNGDENETFKVAEPIGDFDAINKKYFEENGGGIGTNQDWQDVASQRVANIEYINTTGKPIQVSLSFNRSGGTTAFLVIDGTLQLPISDTDFVNPVTYIIIPPNATYELRTTASVTIISWLELR